MEGYWSILKRGICVIYHQVSSKHLQRYCDEFAARYNTRDIKDNVRFENAVKNSEARLKYNQLKAAPKKRADHYDPKVKTDLTFDQLIAMSVGKKPQENKKP